MSPFISLILHVNSFLSKENCNYSNKSIDSTQLYISMAIVIGPTPPGTWGYGSTWVSTSSKSTSPQSFPPIPIHAYINNYSTFFLIYSLLINCPYQEQQLKYLPSSNFLGSEF